MGFFLLKAFMDWTEVARAYALKLMAVLELFLCVYEV